MMRQVGKRSGTFAQIGSKQVIGSSAGSVLRGIRTKPTSFQSGHLASWREIAVDLPQFASSRTFSTKYPPHKVLEMPALSPSMERGNIAKWNKKEGDKFKQGDILAEIETDKATMDWEATEDGYLAKIIKSDGSKEVPVSQPIAIFVEKKEDIAAFASFSAEAESKPAPKESTPPPPKKVDTPQAPPSSPPSSPPPQAEYSSIPGAPPPPGGLPKIGVFASPLAKATASQAGISLQQVQGSGPGGRIIQQDVISASQKSAQSAPVAPPQPVAGQTFVDTTNSNIRKVTAQRLTFSKQTIPHYYLTIEVRIDELLKIRKKLNDQANGAYKLSINDFVVKSSALALKKIPAVNSSWQDEFIRTFQNVDINVAVNTDRGLLTPIVKDADKVGLAHIAETVRILAGKAKDNKLQPHEFQGGTFTISNLGMFGIKNFTAVINPPQACILAVGASEERVIVNPDPSAPNQFITANILTVTLSCDHRVVDGAVGAQWLQEFKKLMEDPLRLLL